MLYVSEVLKQSLGNTFQIDAYGRKPAQAVLFRHRYWKYPDIWKDSGTLDWKQYKFNDSTWGSIYSKTIPSSGWTDDASVGIWSRSGTNVPNGTSYFRKKFTLSADKIVTLDYTADDAIEVYIDGVLKAETSGWDVTTHTTAQFTLSEGSHIIALKGVNNNGRDVDNPAFVAVSLQDTSGNRIVGTDSSWLCSDYPADEKLYQTEWQWGNLTDRVLSIETQRDVAAFAGSFSILLANDEGELAPDSHRGKFNLDRRFRGNDQRFFARQMLPKTEIRIHLGYGDQLVPHMTGYIDSIHIDSANKTINISGRTSYGFLIDNTILPSNGGDILKAPNGNLTDVLKFYFTDCGVEFSGEQAVVPGTDDEDWIVKDSSGKRAQKYDEIVSELVDTTFHYLKDKPDGSVELVPVPIFDEVDASKMVYTFDDGRNLTSLELNLTDHDVKNTVIIKHGDEKDSFRNRYLYDMVSLRNNREEEIEVPWANTYKKRRAAAIAFHTAQLHKYRKMSVGVVAHPGLELLDTIGIRDYNSGTAWKYRINAITTTQSDDGFFQILDVSSNSDADDLYQPQSDLSPIQTTEAVIDLRIWDYSIQDGDIINLYHDGEIIAKNYMITNAGTRFRIPLHMGNNEIMFEGVSAANKLLTAEFEIYKTSGDLLFGTGSLPSLTMARKNVIEPSGVYTARPTLSWTIARI